MKGETHLPVTFSSLLSSTFNFYLKVLLNIISNGDDFPLLISSSLPFFCHSMKEKNGILKNSFAVVCLHARHGVWMRFTFEAFSIFCTRSKQNYNYENPLDREQRLVRWQIVMRFLLIFSSVMADGFAFTSKIFPPGKSNYIAFSNSGNKIKWNLTITTRVSHFKWIKDDRNVFIVLITGIFVLSLACSLLFHHKLFSTRYENNWKNSL